MLKIKRINEKFEKIINIFMLLLPISFLCIGVILDTPAEIVSGFEKIIRFPDSLITDYIAIGGVGATLINSGVLMIVNFIVLRRADMKVNGFFLAGYFIIGGFAFMGNNIVNVLPIYLGAYIYARYQKEDYKRVAVIAIFSTSLAPIVTEMVYMIDSNVIVKLIGGIVVGGFLGFIMPVLSAHMMKFHEGYNLYNVGFTSGVIGTVIVAVLRGFGVVISSHLIISTEYSKLIAAIICIYAFILIAVGTIMNRTYEIRYRNIFKHSGRLVTDYVMLVGYGTTFINMGVMGVIATIYVYISNSGFNGAIMAGIMTLMGFSALGNHPKNSVPIMIGVYLATLLKIWNMSSVAVVISGLFGTTLAPIAGVYGWGAGMIAGFLHLSVVMNIGYLHGGVNLYNNGFSGGIVAAVLVPIIDAFRREE